MTAADRVDFAGDRGRLSVRAVGDLDGAVHVEISVAVEGLAARADAEIAVDDLAAFWIELDAVCGGRSAAATLAPLSGSPWLEILAGAGGEVRLRARLRPGAGLELRCEIELGRSALAESRDALARLLARRGGPQPELFG